MEGRGRIYYIVDENSGLAQIAAEIDGSGNVTASYTLNGNERISMERGGKTSYYLHDGHGSVRGLYDGDGRRTDSYSYDAYGNLLTAEGETENDFLYTGEQYNAGTGLYYLRARYMDPSTGAFISMDSYQGNLYDPVSLHKYLYANANPVMNTDPTGCFSIGEALTQFAGSATISGAEIRHNAMVITIGLGILYQLRHVVAMENAVIRYHQAMAKILIDGKVFEDIDQVVAYVNELVREENKDKRHCYVVYTLVDKEKTVRYVGRTKDYKTRIGTNVVSIISYRKFPERFQHSIL